MSVDDDRYISAYYLYREGDPAAIKTAHRTAFDDNPEWDWDPPFLRTAFGNVSIGCEDIAAEMTGMDHPDNYTYEGAETWDLFETPLCEYFLKSEHDLGTPDLVGQFADMIAVGYEATDDTPLAAHAESPAVRAAAHTTDTPPFTAQSLAHDEYERLSWITIFTPPVVETYGRETLLSAPAWETRELDDGAVLVIAYGDPHDPDRERYEAVAEHIGIEAY
ncbi:hypothetical protein GJ629_02915 [Halapricum sp. CBA1109]|uniref:hypothetical protein n=1 Tax=Halapricum sp. CBA1109 TaxID=2668068 RepID=UPI0012F78759|nr:hypothetical protein [Halapricum sp. CBA1109]MUV88972.1 hypothetical protein [Halapricum sp. CBA1109]